MLRLTCSTFTRAITHLKSDNLYALAQKAAAEVQVNETTTRHRDVADTGCPVVGVVRVLARDPNGIDYDLIRGIRYEMERFEAPAIRGEHVR